MPQIKNIIKLFDKNDKKKLVWIFLSIIAITFLEAASFASVIPVFKTLFLNEIPGQIDTYFTNFLNFIGIKPFGEDYSFGASSLKKFIIIVLFFLIFLIKSLILILFSYFLAKFFGNFCIKISNRIFYYSLNQDYLFFIDNTMQDFLRKVTTDVNGVKSYVISVINLFIEILFLVAISLLLIIVNYQIFLFNITIFTIVFSIYFYIVKKKIIIWSLLFQKNNGLLHNLVFDGIKGIKDIICYGLEKKYLNDFSKNVNNIYSSQLKIDFLNNIQRFWMEIVAVAAMSMPLVFFMYYKVDIKDLIPVFGLYGIAIFRLIPSLNRIVMHIQNINFYKPSFDSVHDVLNNSKVYSNNTHADPIIFKKCIEFKNVDFFFKNINKKILNNVNLVINKGDCIAIKGLNGSGKTTILNLISGLIKESSGSILIDDIYKIYENKTAWCKNISYVQQNVFLLNTSIKNNIILDERNFDEKKFEKITSLLDLNLFFSNLTNGINSTVGSDGTLLSGGQKQIISIARALYKDSDVIIFDEPNSALDEKKSGKLSEIIKILNTNKTIIVVTHDTGSFKGCFNKIAYIDKGEIRTEHI
jgi:ABC-type bacteriocin/lantibiotic exporter with double-glycine peptidase domain